MLSSNERQRRLWAAEHDPELVTNDQAMEMFGHKSFAGFKRFLELNGVETYANARWPNSRFYNKSQVEQVAYQYLTDNPRFRTRAESFMAESAEEFNALDDTLEVFPARPHRVRKELATFHKFIPDYNWTKEQFMEYWESQLNYGATADILDRAPSIFKMKPSEAFALVRILTNYPVKDYGGIPGYRLDRMVFVKAVRSIAKNKAEQTKLMDIILRLYTHTELCKLPPYDVVAVIRELLVST